MRVSFSARAKGTCVYLKLGSLLSHHAQCRCTCPECSRLTLSLTSQESPLSASDALELHRAWHGHLQQPPSPPGMKLCLSPLSHDFPSTQFYSWVLSTPAPASTQFYSWILSTPAPVPSSLLQAPAYLVPSEPPTVPDVWQVFHSCLLRVWLFQTWFLRKKIWFRNIGGLSLNRFL